MLTSLQYYLCRLMFKTVNCVVYIYDFYLNSKKQTSVRGK